MPTHSSGDTNFVGQHQFFDFNGSRAYWAWITNDGTLTGGNSIPKVLSHEICEACSDPDLGRALSPISVPIRTKRSALQQHMVHSEWCRARGLLVRSRQPLRYPSVAALSSDHRKSLPHPEPFRRARQFRTTGFFGGGRLDPLLAKRRQLVLAVERPDFSWRITRTAGRCHMIERISEARGI